MQFVSSDNPDFIEFDNETWKRIPCYPDLYATKTGRIGAIRGRFILEREYQKSNQVYRNGEDPETAHYILVSVPGKRGGRSRSTVLVHRLVCLTWNGPPPGNDFNLQVNHIDLKKMNNHADNLEWATGSKNVEHTYNVGRHKVATRFIAVNQATGETKTFRSISEVAKEFGIGRAYVMAFVAKYSKEPKDDWTFQVIEDPNNDYIHHRDRQIMYKDYVKDEIVLASSCQEASRLTGVTASTIVSAVKRNRLKGPTLTGRHVFQDFSMDMEWPSFNVEQVGQAIRDMDARRALTESIRHRF